LSSLWVLGEINAPCSYRRSAFGDSNNRIVGGRNNQTVVRRRVGTTRTSLSANMSYPGSWLLMSWADRV